MRFALACLLLAAALPVSAQVSPDRMERFLRVPKMPPEIISSDTIIRDAARIDPEHVRVEIDNDTTRALRIKLAVGSHVPDHDDRAGVLVCLNGCHLRFVSEGRDQDVHLRAGETLWMKAARRVARNIGASAVEWLYVESK